MVIDQGLAFVSLGSGMVFVYESGTLALRGSIPLPTVNGNSPRIILAGVSGLDPGFVVATTGTPHIGPLFGVQPSALIEVDIRTLRAVRSLDLHDWLATGPYSF